MVQVQFGSDFASIEDGQWSGENKSLIDLLNTLIPLGGPGGQDPDPDYHAAQRAIDALGYGKITKADEVEYIDGRIY
jgi:hypothetical protein